MAQKVQRAKALLSLSGLALLCPVAYSCAQLQESDQYGDASLDPPEGGNGGGGGTGGEEEDSTVATTMGGVSSVTVTLGVSNTTMTSDTTTSTTGTTDDSSSTESVTSAVTTDATSSGGASSTDDTSDTSDTGGADACPNDPNKTEAGQCGCGMPDTDSDSDGTADCNDDCPNDPDKTDPGDCGCGMPDDAGCAALAGALIHRYSFDGNGSTITDSVGNANGTLTGGSQSGGFVSLNGSAHVDLPGGLLSGLSAVTLEAWYNWSGGSAWQRVFDFGISDAGSGSQGDGESYLFLTPQAVDSSGFLRAAFSPSGGAANEVYVDASSAPTNTTVHATVTVNASTLSLYRGANLEGSGSMTASLSSLNDQNNWLGWSQFQADPGFSGNILEFRIYNAALTGAQVQTSDTLGADAALGN